MLRESYVKNSITNNLTWDIFKNTFKQPFNGLYKLDIVDKIYHSCPNYDFVENETVFELYGLPLFSNSPKTPGKPSCANLNKFSKSSSIAG